MKRILLFVGLIVLGMSFASVNAADAKRPNIVLMMADDMGWGDTGYNGNTIIKTPHLDAMAAGGLKMNRFYAAAPVCSPTRGSVITGRHPFRYGIYSANVGHIKAEELTLAELLKTQGYTTGHFGKWHIGTLTTEVKDANRGKPGDASNYATPQDNGYDVCLVTESKVPTYDPLLQAKGAKGKFWDHTRIDGDATAYGTHYWNEKGESVTENMRGDDSRIIVDRAVPFMEEAVAEGKPFFTIIWFHAPHLPVVAGPRHLKMYEQYSEYERNYYGCITALDEQVGRVRSTLRELGVEKDTLLFYCADNGPEGQSGSAPGTAGPYRGRKRDLYEGGVRVPGLWEWPGRIEAGSETDFPASTVDYLPTLLDVLGIEMPKRPYDGVSLTGLIDGRLKERNSPLGFQSKGVATFVTQQYKLMKRSGKNGDVFELYDLLADPYEKNDIAEGNAKIVKRLAKGLAEWQASCVVSDEGGDYD